MSAHIGTILHGALGDCYEQILCLQKYRQAHPQHRLTAFFAVPGRLRAFQHYDLSVFDQVLPAEAIGSVAVDRYYQFQIRDEELQEDTLARLPAGELAKFDRHNLLPWQVLRRHDFAKAPLRLELSSQGKRYLDFVRDIHKLPGEDRRFKVGFLWRFRKKGLNSFGQYPPEVIKKNISELLHHFVREKDAHILVCGMGAGRLDQLPCRQRVVEEGGVALGEHRWKFEEQYLDLPEGSVTYLMGTGYAAEMEIMSQCDLLITMPSGFSEPLWMRAPGKVVMVFPPYEYLAKLWWHRAPFFDNDSWSGKRFNTFTFHSPDNVLSYLKARRYYDS